MPLFKTIFLVIFLGGCSTKLTNENYVQEASAEFIGGVFKNEEWNTSLKFKRYTWLRHMNMNFDFLVHRLDRSSKFNLWFGEDEKRDIDRCPQFFIFLTYANPSSNLTFHRFETQLKAQNFYQIQINEFAKYLENHPAYYQYNLTKYDILAYCQKDFSQNTKYSINFPGYKEVLTKF